MYLENCTFWYKLHENWFFFFLRYCNILFWNKHQNWKLYNSVYFSKSYIHLHSLQMSHIMRKPVLAICSIIPILAKSKLSRLWLVSVVEQAGLSLTWSQTPKTGFLVTLKYGLCLLRKRRLWSDWADVQADPSLHWAHSHFVGFVQSDQSSLSARRKLGSLSTHWAHNKDSDQTGRMPRLMWVFTGCKCHFVGFVMRGFKYDAADTWCNSYSLQSHYFYTRLTAVLAQYVQVQSFNTSSNIFKTKVAAGNWTKVTPYPFPSPPLPSSLPPTTPNHQMLVVFASLDYESSDTVLVLVLRISKTPTN